MSVVSPVTPNTSNAPTKASNATSSLSQLSSDYTRFLKLLTAQISNQDPLAPMDSGQFITQLAQLSQVEQSVKTNSNLETIQGSISSFSALSGTNLLGHKVTVESNKMELVNGASDASYKLAAPAASVSAEVRTPSGNLVRTIRDLSGADTSAVPLQWDGLSDSGQPLANGTYELKVLPVGANGKPLAATVLQQSNVQEMTLDYGKQFLRLSNGENVPLLSALAVR